MLDLSNVMSRDIDALVRDVRSLKLRSAKSLWFFNGYAASCRRAARKRARSEGVGDHIPPFLIASITTNCNLFCAGCYARANKSCGEHLNTTQLSADRWGALFGEAREMGVSFILLAGGEPLLRRDVLEKAAQTKEILFPVFTNGTLIADAYLDLF